MPARVDLRRAAHVFAADAQKYDELEGQQAKNGKSTKKPLTLADGNH